MNTANLPLKDLIVKLGKSQHLRADIFQNAFMNLLGWTILFAARHIGIALPRQLSIVQAPLVVSAAMGTDQLPGKGKLVVNAIAFREFSGFLLKDELPINLYKVNSEISLYKLKQFHIQRIIERLVLCNFLLRSTPRR